MNITRECRRCLLKCYTLYIYDSLLVAAGARTRAVQETQKGVAARAKHTKRREVITWSACLLIVNTMNPSLALPCATRWRALQISCAVAARNGLDLCDPTLLLRLTRALKTMPPVDAHAVLSALLLAAWK